MPTVLIFPFEVYDPVSDQMVRSRRWGTREAVEQVAHGCVIEEGALEVPRHFLDTDIPGMTHIGFDPQMQLAVIPFPPVEGGEPATSVEPEATISAPRH